MKRKRITRSITKKKEEEKEEKKMKIICYGDCPELLDAFYDMVFDELKHAPIDSKLEITVSVDPFGHTEISSVFK